MAETYIAGGCQVGMVEPCGAEASHVIAVVAVLDTPWMTDGRRGGVVRLCAAHAGTPVTGWPALAEKED